MQRQFREHTHEWLIFSFEVYTRAALDEDFNYISFTTSRIMPCLEQSMEVARKCIFVYYTFLPPSFLSQTPTLIISPLHPRFHNSFPLPLSEFPKPRNKSTTLTPPLSYETSSLISFPLHPPLTLPSPLTLAVYRSKPPPLS